MSGITDAPFRRLAAQPRGRSGRVRDDGLRRARGRQTQCRSCGAKAAGIRAHVVQLAGCEDQMDGRGRADRRGEGADIIDINMGCPARHVTDGQSGSALMRDLDHAVRLIEATVAAVNVPVTLKMRLGWDERSLQRAGVGAPRRGRRACS